ncbi:Crp/Fnr family transcriptional regulator [Ruegeria sp.]|uniref:Crp/Fnr family transcriptional regulator n=1 Tax=Ruegeria sp. TaxID=1879320 RepID=UPI00230F81E9|nr:Crp/Fnr family transcriptional regulator [Ruegeria sp.]MDA7963258.1 Crp/Fnr family transcriptional regulator [Ruegeria sp.]
MATRNAGFQKAFLACGVSKIYEPDAALFHQGDPADGIYGVLSGGVRITAPADDGQNFTLHQEGGGFWVGDLALFASTRRLISVIATQRTETLFFPSSRLERLVKDNPDYLRDFYALSHENMQKALRIIANLGVTGTLKRLVLRLLHLEEVAADPDGWIQVSQEELAAMIAVSMPTLHRSLQRLVKQGLIEGGYGRLRLKDRGALISLCQS